ncbi:Gfo/Idh/MocA family oxidoreductase (plasmid) [Streptomyces sp. BB1-1-1]|uniref:Gfo/Idh/MocA family protein n=1 Tax=Streptomyces sp. BB1-1-1 TaxID=3074430 RepID=UPI0028772C1D|nr:Gfo/Idh/MocA family oxidoreductase [Streptomyces sp. BB1-1-1]WND32852.1 Gfo/Idh/MocA family oxidoreductase [Streptomyces sp. BB1-1-1]WND40080.1 Gfo/Idh/MocA family oxidoreductase [Streptomyces sp. BB1-1-1]WND40914.1 Gfo/Idh/MocA family oxidoreductase [Streptomyces sp. BB1-1-1]
MTWGIGLIGATGIAVRAVITPSRERRDITVRAVAASDRDRASAFGQRHRVRVLSSYEDVVTAPDVDIVYVSLHNSAHAHWARMAIAEGKTVLVEKPLCLGLTECDTLRDAEHFGGGKVLEALPTLRHPWSDVVRHMLEAGRFGRLHGLHSRFGFQPPASGGFRLRPELGGGIFLDSASYWLQALQDTVGLPPASGAGTGTARSVEPHGVDHAFEAELSLPGAAKATLSCSFAARHTAEHVFEFDEARVRVRGVLLPTAGAVPLNVAVRTTTGRTEITRTEPVSYYVQQLDRVADLMSGRGGHWGAQLAAARPRIVTMERLHRTARREITPSSLTGSRHET